MSETLPIPWTTGDIEERQVNSEYGQIYLNNHYQQDLIGFSGTVAVGRLEIPVAGKDSTVYRTSRKTRDGTLSYRKTDSRFEDLLLTYMNLTPDDRRALRAQGIDPFPNVQLMVVLNDPDSWGVEIIQLNHVNFWSLPIGYTGQDLIQRDIPITWKSEQLLLAIARPGNNQGYIGTAGAASALGYQLPNPSLGGFGDIPVF